MFSATTVLLAIIGYAVALFCVAQWAERSKSGQRLSNHPAIYALGLAVYCTTWTFYGSVGKASTGGMGFLPVYLGPTLALFVGGALYVRMAKLKHAHRITSIADFISARYGRSQAVAALVTAILMVGIVPYVGLQLKALSGSARILMDTGESTSAAWFSPVIAGLMALFTIVFGIRHLDPTERHPGMIVSVAAESILKLVAFVAAGTFVVGLAFGDFGGFVEHIKTVDLGLPMMGRGDANQVMIWLTVGVLSMSAFMFLPRQFHVAIVENGSPKHIRTARWLTPLYLLAINVFVVPIALGGNLVGGGEMKGDQYVLALPIANGNAGLAMAVFLGGLSAGIGMIMISAMTMATMISNHLVMPAVQAVRALQPLRRRMLQVRWVAATAFIFAGYAFEVGIGNSYMLVSIGLISFAAAFILAPIVVFGVYWPAASKSGALAGLSCGFAAWFYTLLMPTFIKSGWLPESILTDGPFGLGWARPEGLFGLELPGLVHGVLISGGLTLTSFVGVSLAFPASREERALTDRFLDVTGSIAASGDSKKTIPVDEKRNVTRELLGRYFSDDEADILTDRVLLEANLAAQEHMSAVEMAELYNRVEQTLAGAIGAASAHAEMKHWGEIDLQTAEELAASYARMMADLKLSPKEIAERIDFQAERESLLEEQFAALQKKIEERDAEIVQRQAAEANLQRAHDELEDRVRERTAELARRTDEMRLVLDNVDQGLVSLDLDGHLADERSAAFDSWLGDAAGPGKTLIEALGAFAPETAKMLDLGLDGLKEGFMPAEVVLGQIPERVRVEDRTLGMRFDPIERNGETEALLAVLTDITAELERERMEERQKELLTAFRLLSSDRRGFVEFLTEGDRIVEAIQETDGPSSAEAFRLVHTLKGNSRVFGIHSVGRRCHGIEDALAEGGSLPAEAVAELGAHWTELRAEFNELLGIDGENKVDLPASTLQELIRLAEEGAPTPEILEHLVDWTLEPAEVTFDRLSRKVCSLAERLGKAEVDVRIEGGDVRFDAAHFGPFLSTLVHVVRNAVDHGVETEAERTERGKPGVANVTFRAAREDGGILFEISDDGRGIQWERLAEKARTMGLPSESRSDLIEALFSDGVSTSEEVTDVSGRGVGMAAVREAVLALGGTIDVVSEEDEGTTFCFHLPATQPAARAAA